MTLFTVLRDPERATSLYQQLNFEVVQHVKEHGDNVVMHERYISAFKRRLSAIRMSRKF